MLSDKASHEEEIETFRDYPPEVEMNKTQTPHSSKQHNNIDTEPDIYQRAPKDQSDPITQLTDDACKIFDMTRRATMSRNAHKSLSVLD